ncbi:MAG TPA: type IV pilus biogenesis/stability protein PilW [Gammaproteobacteria bacterium]|nr:type IV pilus biogenesis/stability protein PilW [Gammaproteobacteria bacterium]
MARTRFTARANWRPGISLLVLALAGCTVQQNSLNPDASSSQRSGFGDQEVPAICSEPQPQNSASLAKKPTAAQLQLRLGIGYMQEGAHETALTALERSIQLAPQQAEAHAALALLNVQMKRHDEARNSYRRALRLEPGNPEINNNYGYFLCQQGEYLAADRRFQCAIANPLYSTPWRAYYNAGICALEAGELKQADIYLRTTRQLAPDLPQPLYYLADLAHRRGSHEQAADYLKRFRQVASPSAASLWLGVQIGRALDDRDMEASYSLSLRNLFPDSDQAQSLFSQ